MLFLTDKVKLNILRQSRDITKRKKRDAYGGSSNTDAGNLQIKINNADFNPLMHVFLPSDL